MAEVTQLLSDWRAGDDAAFQALWDKVYQHMRRIARGALAGERAGHTLSTTALVHEAYEKLAGQDQASFTDRAHFLSVAAMAMRRILITHARSRSALKRGAGVRPVTLEEQAHGGADRAGELIAIDDLITKLSGMDERQGKVVVYRYFGGLTDAEIAEALSVSIPTVRRAWRSARAWLLSEINRAEPAHS